MGIKADLRCVRLWSRFSLGTRFCQFCWNLQFEESVRKPKTLPFFKGFFSSLLWCFTRKINRHDDRVKDVTLLRPSLFPDWQESCVAWSGNLVWGGFQRIKMFGLALGRKIQDTNIFNLSRFGFVWILSCVELVKDLQARSQTDTRSALTTWGRPSAATATNSRLFRVFLRKRTFETQMCLNVGSLI